MSVVVSKQSSDRTKKKAWWKRDLLLVFCVLIVLPTFLVGTLAMWPDSEPPDDSDYLPVWDDQLADNPLTSFEFWLTSQLAEVEDPRLKELLKEGGWETAKAKAVLEDHQEALDQFDILASQTDTTWQWKARESMAHYDYTVPELGIITETVIPLVRIRAQVLAEDENWEACSKSISSLLEVGKSMSAARGNLIRYMVSLALSRSAFSTLDALKKAGQVNFSSPCWVPLVSTILNTEPNVDDLRFANKVEYLTFINEIKDIKRGDHQEQGDDLSRLLQWKVFLKENNTKRLYIEVYDPLDATLSESWEAAVMALEGSRESTISMRQDLPGLYLSGNFAGRILITIVTPVYLEVTERSAETVARFRVWQAYLAQQQAYQQNGAIPAIGDLVPKYLPSIPTDPFSGDTIKWRSDSRIIYSIGSDLIDNQGLINQPKSSEFRDIGVAW